MKNGVAYKNQNVYLKINIYLNRATKHPLCDLDQCCHYIETSPLVYGANQWDGSYTMLTLDWKKLILTTTLSIYYFFLSWINPLSPSVNLTRHIFHKSIKSKMQTEILAKNSHKQFYVLLNTNQTKLYTYPDLLKENALLRKLPNSESTAYILDETF